MTGLLKDFSRMEVLIQEERRIKLEEAAINLEKEAKNNKLTYSSNLGPKKDKKIDISIGLDDGEGGEVLSPDISNVTAINSIRINRDSGQQNTPVHTLVIRPQRAPVIRSQVVPWTKTLSLLGASALTVVIVVSLGFESVRSGAQYAAVATSTPENRVAALVSNLLEPVLVSIENFIAPEIKYSRQR
jgi:hypothetical protein